MDMRTDVYHELAGRAGAYRGGRLPSSYSLFAGGRSSC